MRRAGAVARGAGDDGRPAARRALAPRRAGAQSGRPAAPGAGRGGAGAVLLVAHYDSRPNTPGAGDDASGVAVVLETVRALAAGPPLGRDLIVLLSDGEELGLLGARGFAAEHPWMDEVDLVLNFEARGSRGPAAMFETGERRPRPGARLRPGRAPSAGQLAERRGLRAHAQRHRLHGLPGGRSERPQLRLSRRARRLPHGARHGGPAGPGEPAARRRQRAGADPPSRRWRRSGGAPAASGSIRWASWLLVLPAAAGGAAGGGPGGVDCWRWRCWAFAAAGSAAAVWAPPRCSARRSWRSRRWRRRRSGSCSPTAAPGLLDTPHGLPHRLTLTGAALVSRRSGDGGGARRALAGGGGPPRRRSASR